MPTQEELINLIAAATAQLNGLKKLPDEEPVSDEQRMFQCVIEIQGAQYTYLLLCVPNRTDQWGGCWYVTGTLIGQRTWVRWGELIHRLSKYTVVSWTELVPKEVTE